MIAKFFKAKKCIIYTDVDGIFTTDPKIEPKAKKIKKISYEEMLEMASLGSKVMQPHSIQDARLNQLILKFVLLQKFTRIFDYQKKKYSKK